MIKDRLTEAIEANYDKIQKGDDHIPIGMRGELEVIVKDRNGNVKSYERDHNQVTKLAKMALLHLLAGEIGTVDSEIYSIPKSGSNMRAYSLNPPAGTASTTIFSSFDADNHDNSKNLDGCLVSGQGFFYDGDAASQQLFQIDPKDKSNSAIKFNFPTKMLFGTGLESYDVNNITNLYSSDFGAPLDSSAILVLNGYSSTFGLNNTFLNGCSAAAEVANYDITGIVNQTKRLSNWYSANAYRCRTLQPASTQPMKNSPTSETTAITGAIKNCFIEQTSDGNSLYNPTTKMAMAPYRGFGRPCFIYATRNTSSFYDMSEGNENVYYSRNTSFSQTYETEVTYTVVMPAQPVASNSITTFYPYNGWVLRQAGLFCDSRYKIRTASDTDDVGETTLLNKVNGSVSDSDYAHTYRDDVGGQLLFVRNLSSPILKTADDEVTFIWHIFITV